MRCRTTRVLALTLPCVSAVAASEIPRPFPETGDKQTRIVPMSRDAAYIVRTMRFPGTPRVEVVTKIWRRRADGWKMVHFQSTVVDLQPPRQP